MRAAVAALALIAGGAACAAAAYPEAMRPVQERVLDDPKAALVLGREALARGDAESQFWLWLALAGVHTVLEQTHAAQHAVDEARAVLARLPGPTPRHQLWLEAYAIGAGFRVEDAGRLIQRSVALRRAAVTLGDDYLLCEISAGDLFLLRDTNALDEAWLAAEETERCGRRLGQAQLETAALIALGGMAGDLTGKAPTESYFERALDVLGARPARFQRAWIEWELGNAVSRQGQSEKAAQHFEIALARSREIGDESGEAIITLDLAALRLAQGEHQRVLALVRGVLPALQAEESPVRVAVARGLLIQALARMKRFEVLQEIDRARELDQLMLPPLERARLARRVAEGYASQGQYAQAYAELLRSTQATGDGQQSVRDAQVLRLQARYELARREVEVADLRHRAEAARLELQAREAQQRALWAALLALSGMLAFGFWFTARALARRRHLADLAMRDELTGMPNRRAILAFGHEQFRLSRRLDLDLSVAIVDLDHFKAINDRWGHASGDRVLRGFAAVAHSVLRSQDRMGRYGGDEWLLVMPGVGADELAPIFDRLRAGLAAQTIEGLPQPHGITVSMGGAELLPAIETLDALIAEADQQLYHAKVAGRDALRHQPAQRSAATQARPAPAADAEAASLPASA
jgi:diguanylate cyclase (GGDEF)-like protein